MRRSLFFIAIGSLLILVSFLVYSISTKMTAKQTAKEKLIRSPKLDLYDLDSARFELPGSALAMIFFDTECDFCQHEASEILSHRKMFVDKNIVMISAEPIVT